MAAKDIEAGRAHVLIALRDRVTGGLKKLERNVAGFGRNFATLGTALVAGSAGAIAFPLKLSANMEQLGISFEVMLGSAEASKKMLADLADFAKKTPFGLEDLATNAQLLLNFGVASNRILPDLRALGDVAAGNRDKFNRLALAYGQTQAKGRLMGGEVMQMVEAGFNPLSEMARTTGKSVATLQEEMEDGAISAQMLTAAFQSASGPGGKFNGMMDKMSGSGVGLLSTLMDAVSFGFKPLGDATLVILKPLATWAITVADAFGAFTEKNKWLASAIAKTLLGLMAIGGILAAVGFAGLALSTVIGGIATMFGLLASAIGFLFSPLGIILIALTAVAVGAWYFRAQLAAAFAQVAEFFRPLTDALYEIWAIFRETFGGIVNALMSGELSTAAAIAWLGFVAAAWQGVANFGTAISGALMLLQAWIPGIDGVANYVKSAFASIGESILAGRWDLAAAIMMAKVRLVVTDGWNAITSTWTGFTVILGNLWDSIISGIQTTWRSAVTEIAKWLVWIAEQLGFAMDGVQAELDRMNKSDQGQADKAQAAREQARYAGGAESIAQGDARAKAIRAQIAELETQASAAYAGAGAPTLQDAADKARKDLQQAITEATEKGKKPPPGVPSLLGQQASGVSQLGKLSSAGTFSAAGAALSLGFNSKPQEETAKNTKKMVKLMEQQQNNQAAFAK